MQPWNSVFGSASTGPRSLRADGSGRSGSLRAERSGGPGPSGAAHRTGKRGGGADGGPGRLSAERRVGKPPSGGGHNGPECGKTERPRAGKPSGGPAPRVGGPRAIALVGPGSAKTERSTDRVAFELPVRWDGDPRIAVSKDRSARERFGPGGVRRALRSTLQGPRVQAPGASTYLGCPKSIPDPASVHRPGRALNKPAFLYDHRWKNFSPRRRECTKAVVRNAAAIQSNKAAAPAPETTMARRSVTFRRASRRAAVRRDPRPCTWHDVGSSRADSPQRYCGSIGRFTTISWGMAGSGRNARRSDGGNAAASW